MNLPPGQTLGGFQIKDKIGRGSMGTVYRARQVALERDVALKVIDSFDDAEAYERFHQEAIRLANLKHPNILPVFDFGRQEDVTYIAMELADGGTLAAQMGQPMAPMKALQTLKPAAQAIDFAHQANIVHRDVKPANLLFDGNGRLFLSDFGLALMRDTKSSSWGQMVGTPWYMAPEQFRTKAEPASDIYALAVTVFQLLTGRVPYDRENPLAVGLAHLKDPIPSAREMNPMLPEQVDRILQRGLAKEPAARFTRAIELLAAIAQALQRQDGSTATGSSQSRPQATAAAQVASAPRPAVPASGVPAPQGPAPATPAPSGGAAPAPGPVIFESKPTPEWAKANLIMRDTKSGSVKVHDDVIELTLAPPNMAQLMLLALGVREQVWAELQFGVATASGIFDLLWNEGQTPESYCLRVDTQQGRLALGVVPATGSGGERWLGSRNVGFGPGTEHTVFLASGVGMARVYLDGREMLAVTDATLAKGMVRLRLLPAAQNAASTLLLKRLAVFRPPT